MANRKKKKILIVGGVILAVIALILLVLLFGPQVLRSRIEATASRALKMEVHVRGKAGFSFFPALGASLADVQVTNGGLEVATLARAKVGLKLLPLITGKVRISRMELVKPVISIVRQKDGKLSIETQGGETRGIPTALEKLVVSQGVLHLTDLKPGGGIVLEGVDIAALNLSAGGTPGGCPLKTLSDSGEIR